MGVLRHYLFAALNIRSLLELEVRRIICARLVDRDLKLEIASICRFNPKSCGWVKSINNSL